MVKRGLMMEPSLCYASDLQFRNLMRSYVQLDKEIQTMKKRLNNAKERKSTLKGEVGFLRRRYQFLKSIKAPKTPLEQAPLAPRVHRKSLKIPKSCTAKKNPLSIPVLNQSMSGKQVAEEVHQLVCEEEPLRLEDEANVPQELLLQQQQQRDVTLLVCEPMMKRPGKRKISWRDPVALRA